MIEKKNAANRVNIVEKHETVEKTKFQKFQEPPSQKLPEHSPAKFSGNILSENLKSKNGREPILSPETDRQSYIFNF